MKNFLETPNLKAKILRGGYNGVEKELNEFLQKHQGDIVDIQFQSADASLCMVLVTYREL